MSLRKALISSIVLILTLFVTFLLLQSKPPLVDESYYIQYIDKLLSGIVEKPAFTVLPGYTFIIAGIAHIFNLESLQEMRLVSFLMSILTIVALYIYAYDIDKKNAFLKTVQSVSLPFLYPFLFLIYTDIASLLFVLVSFLLYSNKKYWLSGLIAGLSILIRQNNIIWLLLLLGKILLDKKSRNVKNVWTYILSIVGFAIFVIFNGGLAVGEAEYHPSFTFHLGNIYFILATFCILFLPEFIHNIKSTIHTATKNKLVTFIVLLISILFLTQFEVTHPNNVPTGYVLRNDILNLVNVSIIARIIASFMIFFAGVSLISSRFIRKDDWIILALSFAYLLPSWLIEPRYYIIPTVLFIVHRKVKPHYLYLSIFVNILLTTYIMSGVLQGTFFP